MCWAYVFVSVRSIMPVTTKPSVLPKLRLLPCTPGLVQSNVGLSGTFAPRVELRFSIHFLTTSLLDVSPRGYSEQRLACSPPPPFHVIVTPTDQQRVPVQPTTSSCPKGCFSYMDSLGIQLELFSRRDKHPRVLVFDTARLL